MQEEGAATSVYCATANIDGYGGRYFAKCRTSQMASAAAKEDNARKFWCLSEEMLNPNLSAVNSPRHSLGKINRFGSKPCITNNTTTTTTTTAINNNNNSDQWLCH